MKLFYLTTTLPYVNAKPHIGHALEFVQADVITRRRRLQGDSVIFNVGTDEHGLKIYEKAAEADMDVRDFVDMNVKTFFEFCEHFQINYDSFYRTSDPKHHLVAQAFRRQSYDHGDIYEKRYTGLYCVGCESFKTPRELVDGKCPDHLQAPIPYEEQNYFFRLSKYKDQLLRHIIPLLGGDKQESSIYREEGQGVRSFVLPHHKSTELANFVEQMEDISISRKKDNLPRGVPVPDDESQVMYVWFDALTNYVGAVGYPHNLNKLNEYRPTTVQICGPDNLRFQGAIRQGMLASAGITFTSKLLIHGMVLGPDGNKMSKTLGNVISPMDQLEKYGLEAVRFYLIAGLPTYGDAAYKEDDLVALYNSRLANSFGNLLSRVIQLANKKEISLKTTSPSALVHEQIETTRKMVADAYDAYQLYEAAGQIHDLAIRANKYMDDHKPRDKELDHERVTKILQDLGALCHTLIDLYTPIIPTSCTTAREMLDTKEKGVLFVKIEGKG